MKDIRIVFFGTPEFSCEILKCLHEEGYQIVAAVSQPDKPIGRKQEILPTPIHALADTLGIPCVQPFKLREEVDTVLSYEPDLILTCAYGQIIPEAILTYPKYGCLNIHPSLLPKYRGGAPVHRAILNGDEETGVCLMEMVKAMDAGRVYDRRIVPITEDMTTEELNLILEKESCILVREALPKYLNGELEGEVQDEKKVVIARNIAKEEDYVSFQKEEIHMLYNHIRGLIDWPIAYGVIENKRMKFYRVRKNVCIHDYEIGQFVGIEDDHLIITGIGGLLYVYELQLEGKNRMDAKSFFNGVGKNLIGKCFE
ncbi:MAG: methionyl-tRNA formyltransferase [Solobacterium sp.]|nr:methionyl-tRNA formyltransferase [Solobacterium sp.]